MTKQLWQFSESPQRLNDIAREVVSLRRENRFLKVGLIFCLVLSALPYLTGFQPTVIRASKVVTEKIEFVSDEKTVASLVVHPNKIGLVIEDENAKGLVFLGNGLFGGWVGVYNRDGRLAIDMSPLPWGGSLSVYNNTGKPTASIHASSSGGMVSVANDNGELNVTIGVTPDGGIVGVYNKDGKVGVGIDAVKEGGRILVNNKDGNAVSVMGATKKGGQIEVRNNDGEMVVAIGVTGVGGRIEVSNNDGKLVWRTP
jgi:hypothetical protein